MITFLLFCGLQPVEAPAEPYQLKMEYADVGNPFIASVERISLFSSQGKAIWVREVDAPASAFSLNNGRAMLVIHRAPEGARFSLEFINPSGGLAASHNIQYFQQAYVSTKTGRVLVLSARQAILFTNSGQILSSFEGKFCSAAIDASGERFALASQDYLRIYEDSELIAKLRLTNPFLRKLKFSSTGTFLAALTSNSLELWQQGGQPYSLNLLNFDASPLVLSFDSVEKNLLIGLCGKENLKLLKLSLLDHSTTLYTQPLNSKDETILSITPSFSDWRIQLTSGWYGFNSQEAK